MKQSEAMEHVARMLLAVQKCRSNVFETMAMLDSPSDEQVADFEHSPGGRAAVGMFPWLFGPKAVLPVLARVVDQGTVDTSGFYNLMWVAARPENQGMLGVWFSLNGLPDLPEPDMHWMAGWDPETVDA